MAISDVRADYTPKNTNILPIGATVAQLRTALSGFNSTSYSSTRLDTMSERDMRWACKQHGLFLTGE